MTKDQIESLIKQLRASKEYEHWIMLNKMPTCAQCGETKNLHVHHITSLRITIKNISAIFSDYDVVYARLLNRHSDNQEDNITLCKIHHNQVHQNQFSKIKSDYEEQFVNTEEWTAAPRNLDIPFNHNKKRKDGLGFIAFQLIFVLGWHILNKKIDTRIILLNLSKAAKLLNKKSGCKHFREIIKPALQTLQNYNVITAFIQIEKNTYEIHMNKDYLSKLANNPWFIKITEAQTKNMLTLTLKWFLSFHQRKKRFVIGLQKLAIYLGVRQRMDKFGKRILIALNSSKITAKITKTQVSFNQAFKRIVPIHTLRKLLTSIIGAK